MDKDARIAELEDTLKDRDAEIAPSRQGQGKCEFGFPEDPSGGAQKPL